MNAFDVYIEDKLVSEYVIRNSLTEFEQKAEGDELGEFRVESVTLDLDFSFLEKLKYDRYNYHKLYKKKAQIFYYQQLVFSGHIGEINVDYNNEIFTFEFYSIAKIISEISLEGFTTIPNHTPKTVTEVLRHLITVTNYEITRAGFWFNLIDDPYINLEEFNLLRTIEIENPSLPDVTITFPGNLTFRFSTWKGIYKKDGRYFLPSANSIRRGGYNTFLLYSINYEGQFTSYEEIDFNPYGTGDWISQWLNDYGYILVDEWSDERLIKLIAGKLGLEEGETPTFSGKARTAPYTYVAFTKNNGDKYWRVTVTPDDKLNFDYTDKVDVGQILKDIALLTNSLIYITPLGQIRIQNRNSTNYLTIQNPHKIKSELLDRRNARIEIPEQYFLMSQTVEDILNYYKNFLEGIFYQWEITFPRECVNITSEFFITKSLKTVLFSRNLTLGIIKAVTFSEDLITFKTEMRVE